jgi:hypothetical protein
MNLMTDEEFTGRWAVLEPTDRQRRTIERRVFAWLVADATSLTSQWLDLVKLRPLAVLGYATVNALSLIPFGWLGQAMLQ